MMLFDVSRSSRGRGRGVGKKYYTEKVYLVESKKERNDRDRRGRTDGGRDNAAVGGRKKKQKNKRSPTRSRLQRAICNSGILIDFRNGQRSPCLHAPHRIHKQQTHVVSPKHHHISAQVQAKGQDELLIAGDCITDQYYISCPWETP